MHRRWLALLGVLALCFALWRAWGESGEPQDSLSVPTTDVASRDVEAASGVSAEEENSSRSSAAESAVRSTASQTETPPKLEFRIVGVPANECTGTLRVVAVDAGESKLPITEPRVVLPLAGHLRRVAFEIPGYCGAEFHGPFVEHEEPIEVRVWLAGTIAVDVADTKGNPLAKRLVYCHPLRNTPDDVWIQYQTTRWAETNDRGRATIEGVIPGDYNLVTTGVMEWLEATASGVKVLQSRVTSATLRVPVLEQSSFGAFRLELADADCLAASPSGAIRNYAFCTTEGAQHELFATGNGIRCVVRGEQGEIVTGCIAWRSRSGKVQLPSRQSDTIRVTIGAEQLVRVVWSDAAGK